MKNILLVIIVLLVSGCDFDKATKVSVADEKSISFKWVVFDKNEIQKLINERVKAEADYPEGMSYDESRGDGDSRESQMKLATLERQEKEKCDKKLLSADGNAPLSSIAKRNSERGAITDSELSAYYAMRNSPAYRDCISAIEGIQEYVDLKAQEDKSRALQRLKREFEEKLRKKADKVLEKIVAEYGESNSLYLVIDKQSNSVVYNRDKVVLDVTGEIKSIVAAKKNLMTSAD